MRASALFARCFAAVVAATLIAGGASPSAAQDHAGRISVAVRSDAPIPRSARVTLLAPGGVTVTVPLTEHGTAIFEDVAPGIYRVRARIAGATFTSDEFDAHADRVATVAIDARGSSARVIGTVTAVDPVTVTFERIDDDAAVRKISASLADAAAQFAGASVADAGLGREGVFSLRNFDASQVGASIDGIGAGANAGATVAAFGDLFTGASANFTPSANSLGGSLNYSTLQPTKEALANADVSVGDDGKSLLSGSASGSAGRLGFAVQYADRTSADVLDGRTYADESGAAYAHSYARHSIGELVKLRESVGTDVTIEATGLLSNISYGTGCAVFVSELPCGVGRDASSFARFDYASVQARASLGATTIDAYATVNDSHTTLDEAARTFLGTPAPYTLGRPFLSHDATLFVAHPVGLHTPTVSLTLDDSQSTYDATTAAGRTVAFSRLSGLVASASDEYKPNAYLALAFRETFNRSTGVSSGGTTEADATWHFDPKQTLAFTALIGTTATTATAAAAFSAPADARYDCTDGTVRVSGPADAPTPQRTQTLTASYRRPIGDGSISVNAYRTESDGAPLYLDVPIATAAAPQGYLDSLAGIWNLRGVCGGYAFPSTRVYAIENVAGLRQRYNGVTVSGTVPIGRNVVAIGNATRADAQLRSLDARFLVPESYERIGAQLPFTNRYDAAFTVDALLTRSVETLVHASFHDAAVGGLPAHTIVALGARVRAGRGAFTGFIANLLDADAFPFTEPRGSPPLPLAGGGTIGFATAGVAPRQVQIRYEIAGLALGRTPPVAPPKKP